MAEQQLLDPKNKEAIGTKPASAEKKQDGQPAAAPKKEKLVLEGWQRRRLLIWFSIIIGIGVIYLCITASTLYNDKMGENHYWNKYLGEQLSEEHQALAEKVSATATEVKTGSYVETIREINMKSSSYRMVLKVWFEWEGDPELDMLNNFHIYNGAFNKVEELRSTHENGVNYQLARVDVTVFKNFWTRRFPLESHQLRYYIEPDYTLNNVKLVADHENSGTNAGLSYAGFNLTRFADDIHTQAADSTFGQEFESGTTLTSEYMGQIELNRDGMGLYLKCFIALFGTSCWVFITMFLCTYHRVDPLGMIPAALFGTVSNIMVGANLLPDALQTGLLEFVNIWGIFTILSGALVIINVNRIRNKYQHAAFAKFFGRVMFYSLVPLIIIGHIVLPVSAFLV